MDQRLESARFAYHGPVFRLRVFMPSPSLEDFSHALLIAPSVPIEVVVWCGIHRWLRALSDRLTAAEQA